MFNNLGKYKVTNEQLNGISCFTAHLRPEIALEAQSILITVTLSLKNKAQNQRMAPLGG